jgi:hypothetical protein
MKVAGVAGILTGYLLFACFKYMPFDVAMISIAFIVIITVMAVAIYWGAR